MDIPLPDGLGAVVLDGTLRCNITADAATFFAKVPDLFKKLTPSLRNIITRAIDSKEAVPITDQQRMDIGAFFMDAGSFLMKEGMKRMRVCGAAKFIPPRPGNER
jgi:hypothetical protein